MQHSVSTMDNGIMNANNAVPVHVVPVTLRSSRLFSQSMCNILVCVVRSDKIQNKNFVLYTLISKNLH